MLNSKDRKSTRDKANISNPKVNRGCAPLTANPTSADCVQISLGPLIPDIPLGVYHTGSLNLYQASCPVEDLSFSQNQHLPNFKNFEILRFAYMKWRGKICSNPLARLVVLLAPGRRAVVNGEPCPLDTMPSTGTDTVCSTSPMASLIRSVGDLSKYFYQGLWLADLNAHVFGQFISRGGVA